MRSMLRALGRAALLVLVADAAALLVLVPGVAVGGPLGALSLDGYAMTTEPVAWVLQNEAGLLARLNANRDENFRFFRPQGLWVDIEKVFLDAGRPAAALAFARRRAAGFGEAYLDNDPKLIDALEGLARAELAAGRIADAERTLLRVVRRASTRDERMATAIRGLSALRDLYVRGGRTAEAARATAQARALATAYDRRFRVLSLRPLALVLEAQFLGRQGDEAGRRRLVRAAGRLLDERGPLAGDLIERVTLLGALAEERRLLGEAHAAKACTVRLALALHEWALPRDETEDYLLRLARALVGVARWLRVHGDRDMARVVERWLDDLVVEWRVNIFVADVTPLVRRNTWCLLLAYYAELDDVRAELDLRLRLWPPAAPDDEPPPLVVASVATVTARVVSAEAAAAAGDANAASLAVGEVLEMLADRPRDLAAAELTERAAAVLAGLGEAGRASSLRRRAQDIRAEVAGSGGAGPRK